MVEEILTRQVAVSVLVLQGQADREVIVSVQTQADTATGLSCNTMSIKLTCAIKSTQLLRISFQYPKT